MLMDAIDLRKPTMLLFLPDEPAEDPTERKAKKHQRESNPKLRVSLKSFEEEMSDINTNHDKRDGNK